MVRLVAVDFEAGGPTWERLVDTGFDNRRRAVIASTGVSMYLSKDGVRAHPADRPRGGPRRHDGDLQPDRAGNLARRRDPFGNGVSAMPLLCARRE